MAYHRWSGPGQNPCPLYIWTGSDGLHVWKPGQNDEDGLFFVDGKDTVVAESLFAALFDHLTANGVVVKVRAGRLKMAKIKGKNSTRPQGG